VLRVCGVFEEGYDRWGENVKGARGVSDKNKKGVVGTGRSKLIKVTRMTNAMHAQGLVELME
jgi:hypothetical protein